MKRDKQHHTQFMQYWAANPRALVGKWVTTSVPSLLIPIKPSFSHRKGSVSMNSCTYLIDGLSSLLLNINLILKCIGSFIVWEYLIMGPCLFESMSQGLSQHTASPELSLYEFLVYLFQVLLGMCNTWNKCYQWKCLTPASLNNHNLDAMFSTQGT